LIASIFPFIRSYLTNALMNVVPHVAP